MSFMNDDIRLMTELGEAIRAARVAVGMSITELADQSGRVRDVIYRLEAGKDTSLTSLFAVLSVLKLTLRLEPAGRPTLSQVQARFGLDDEDE
ncbi:helix-turn-helix domain-containing protein [Roseateles sp. LKC17W]|uniref:Helix-turn-helix domain-containing protein n=1 Tax=Pelomonas margarita TaxID=3299031 RepID=A0ABW7FI57_9BURK